MLHLDINKTLVMSDPVQGVSLPKMVNALLSECCYGTHAPLPAAVEPGALPALAKTWHPAQPCPWPGCRVQGGPNCWRQWNHSRNPQASPSILVTSKRLCSIPSTATVTPHMPPYSQSPSFATPPSHRAGKGRFTNP